MVDVNQDVTYKDILLDLRNESFVKMHEYLQCIGVENNNFMLYLNDHELKDIDPFSTELSDATIFVIDVAEGDKIPRKGGPGITRSDLLVINKIDLAPYVGADLSVMERDSKKMRDDKPFIFTNIRGMEGVDDVVDWIKSNVLLEGLNQYE